MTITINLAMSGISWAICFAVIGIFTFISIDDASSGVTSTYAKYSPKSLWLVFMILFASGFAAGVYK